MINALILSDPPMGFFDSFRPSSNFAKGIKLMCEELSISVSTSRLLNGDDQRRLYSYAADIVDHRIANPGLSPLIAKDIYRYFAQQFLPHVSELRQMSPMEQDKFLTKLFGNIGVMELTAEIMYASAEFNGLNPQKQFDERDELIIKKVFGAKA